MYLFIYNFVQHDMHVNFTIIYNCFFSKTIIYFKKINLKPIELFKIIFIKNLKVYIGYQLKTKSWQPKLINENMEHFVILCFKNV